MSWQTGPFGSLRLHWRAQLVCAWEETHYITHVTVGCVYGQGAGEHWRAFARPDRAVDRLRQQAGSPRHRSHEIPAPTRVRPRASSDLLATARLHTPGGVLRLVLFGLGLLGGLVRCLALHAGRRGCRLRARSAECHGQTLLPWRIYPPFHVLVLKCTCS